MWKYFFLSSQIWEIYIIVFTILDCNYRKKLFFVVHSFFFFFNVFSAIIAFKTKSKQCILTFFLTHYFYFRSRMGHCIGYTCWLVFTVVVHNESISCHTISVSISKKMLRRRFIGIGGCRSMLGRKQRRGNEKKAVVASKQRRSVWWPRRQKIIYFKKKNNTRIQEIRGTCVQTHFLLFYFILLK